MNETAMELTRSLLYGIVIGFIIHYIVALVESLRGQKSDHAIFVFQLTILGNAWLLVQYIIWFLVDAFDLLPPPVPPYNPGLLSGMLNFVEMLTPVMFAIAIHSMSNMKRKPWTHILLLMLPLAVADVFFICTIDYDYVLMGYIYVVSVFLVISLLVHVNVIRYQKLLNDTYANTSLRGVKWVLSMLYSMQLVFVVWMVMSYMIPSALNDCIYMGLSILLCGFYVNRLRFQNFDIRVIQEIVENKEEEQYGVEADLTEEYSDDASATVDENGITVHARLKAWQDPVFDAAVRRFCTNEKNFTNPDLSVQDVATGVGTNRTYVSRWCKENEVDFSTYITNLRLVFALDKLVNTDMQIIEVGELSGFSNPRHFRTAFAAQYGCTPSEYRNREKKEDN